MSKLIVIDGLDGSGKTTQSQLLFSHIEQNSPNGAKLISFPDYENPSSQLVKMYLAGDFGKDAQQVSAYAASSFYAVDRYASYRLYWEEEYLSGKNILATRYATSNMIHQMGKLPREEWDAFLDWVKDYEYKKLGIPAPDQVIFLDMDLEISAKLLTGRYHGDESKKDIHEANRQYLMNCRESALYAAQKEGWTVIRCDDGENVLPLEVIAQKISESLIPLE